MRLPAVSSGATRTLAQEKQRPQPTSRSEGRPLAPERTPSKPVVSETEIGRVWLKKKKRASAKEAFEAAPWWKKAVTYQILVRSFFDANGDGIGDLDGVRKKLDYLRWLGVDCIWLNPFLASPMKDDGYDVSDYFTVLPQYGSQKDLEKLIEEAHARGMKILMDVAVNHTSDQHPWFQRAIRSPEGSVERDFYVWSKDDQKYTDTRIIFVDTEPSNWTKHPDTGQFYWHRFFSHQPDLNYDNEAVQQAICEVFGYWIDKGVDGFRLDAIPYLFEREGTNCENLEETHAFVKRLRRYVEEKSPDRPIALLAEANQPVAELIQYFGDGDECHLAYDFQLMPEIYAAFAAGSARGFAGKSTGLANVLRERPTLPDDAALATFLRNHDELTLEMVTDDVRDEMYAHYAQDQRARRNVGIGRRLAPLLGNDPEGLRLAQALLLSLDSPVMYYGDEIGMGDDLDLPDRNPVRTPMQWDGKAKNAGFSEAPKDRLAAPLVQSKGFTAAEVNVARQQSQPDSLLTCVRHLLDVRRRHPELALGRLEVVDVGNEDVLGFTRKLGRERALCLYNFSDQPRSLRLDTRVIGGNHLESLKQTNRSAFPKPDGGGIIELTLAPKESLWLGVSKRAETAPARAQAGRRSARANAPADGGP